MGRRIRMTLFLGALALTGCGLLSPAAPTPTATAVHILPTFTATVTETLPPTPSDTPLPTGTPTITPLPTDTPTITPLPAGMTIVPDVIGMDYLDARQTLLDAGLTLLIRDVFDLEAPFGSILEQDPLPGEVSPVGEVVFLVRAFQTAGMPIGDRCQELRPTQREGYIMYAAYLEGGFEYEVRTDFPYAETVIFDQNMTVLAWFNNPRPGGFDFLPEWTGWYIFRMGPYSISADKLAQYTSGAASHCLYVIPPE